MKVALYVLVVVLGAVGVLSILRVGERLMYGGGKGSVLVQLLIGLLCFIGAWEFLKKARVK
jgi:hypothetical protein